MENNRACHKQKNSAHLLLLRAVLVFLKWQQGNAQSLNKGQGQGLKNTTPFVCGRLRNYLLCGAAKSPSNSTLMGPRGKPSSQIKLGSNVWTSYSNSDHLAWDGGEKKIHTGRRWTAREGQQVAVNLEKKRVIIHLEKGSKSVCLSPGSAKLSQAPAGEENRVKQFSAVCGRGSAVYSRGQLSSIGELFHQEISGKLLCLS